MLRLVTVFHISYSQIISIVWLYHILFLHLSTEGRLSCFHFLAVGIHAALNIHSSFCIHVISVLLDIYIYRNGITGSYDNSMFNFFEGL